MQRPDEQGRAAILKHYLKPLKLDPYIEIDGLATEIAGATDGASGADLEYLCQTAARICVKDALSAGALPDSVTITARHFADALLLLGYDAAASTIQ